MRTLIIRRGPKAFTVNAKGEITSTLVKPSGQWHLLGAVERNNFGYIVRRWTFAEIWDVPDAIPWLYKNGKQRVFILDRDHGTVREWTAPSPFHSITVSENQ